MRILLRLAGAAAVLILVVRAARRRIPLKPAEQRQEPRVGDTDQTEPPASAELAELRARYRLTTRVNSGSSAAWNFKYSFAADGPNQRNVVSYLYMNGDAALDTRQ